MISLSEASQDLLRQVVRAGDEGVALETVGVSRAITFALHGLASITAAPEQRVVGTSRARAFSRQVGAWS